MEMLKRILALLMAFCVLSLAGCAKKDQGKGSENEIKTTAAVDVSEYMANLSEEKTAHLDAQTNLLLHPVQDAIDVYGDDYELTWEDVYINVRFPGENFSLEACIGADLEDFYFDTENIDIEEYNLRELVPFLIIERIYFDGEGFCLTDGISIGMKVDEICEKLHTGKITYSEDCTTKTRGYDKEGNVVDVFSIFGELEDIDYTVIFAGDVLAQVQIANDSRYLDVNDSSSDKGKAIIDEAFSFLSENELASFSDSEVSFEGSFYSSHFGSWFYGWKLTEGEYEGYEINVEQQSPYRVYVAGSATGMPFLFWCDGKYADPVLSFLGKWRDYISNEYVDIKAISEEGIVSFDMYTVVDNLTDERALLENLTVYLNEVPKTLDEYLLGEYRDDYFKGECQYFDEKIQSGYYGIMGDVYYLMDALCFELNGNVSYMPAAVGSNRIGTDNLSLHIPEKSYDYSQDANEGLMSEFGRDDPNPQNVVSGKDKAGDTFLNKYLNKIYNTTDLRYSEIDYTYLHDYVFPQNGTTYNVWESLDTEDPHYLYVDSSKGNIIKEREINKASKHIKEILLKSEQPFSEKYYGFQEYSTADGKIAISIEDRVLTKSDAFVKEFALPDIYMDTLDTGIRYMFFTQTGDRFIVNGYLVFNTTTWGATLHITDSNVPDFEIGVYYLKSDGLLLDASVNSSASLAESPTQETEPEVTEAGTAEDTPAAETTTIRDVSGKIIGYIYIKENGDKTVKNVSGKILGYYYAERNVTTDISGKILSRGDTSSALLYQQ